VAERAAQLVSDLEPDTAAMIRGLHRIQHEFGYIPRESIPPVAERFNTSPAIVFGTIDFYSELRTVPPGENVVEWCSGPACLFKNSTGIRRALEAELDCRINTVTPDGKFELRLVQCDGTCELAPQLRFRGKYMGPMTASTAIEFARSLKDAVYPPPPPADEPPAEEPSAEGEGAEPEPGATE
jgi:NADH:ubiquinone oxidoreductase subunit E